MSSLSFVIVHHFAFSQNKQSILQSPFVNGILEYSFSQTHFMGKCVVALLAAINLILFIYEATIIKKKILIVACINQHVEPMTNWIAMV